MAVLISGIAGNLGPRSTGHTHPALATFGQEPPTVQIFNNCPVTENLSIPDTLWTKIINMEWEVSILHCYCIDCLLETINWRLSAKWFFHARQEFPKNLWFSILFISFNFLNFSPPPAFGHPGAMSDFFFSLSFPFSQILTTVVNSRVTAPSHISFPER